MYEELAATLNKAGIDGCPTDKVEKAKIEQMKQSIGIPEAYIDKDLLDLVVDKDIPAPKIEVPKVQQENPDDPIKIALAREIEISQK